MQDSANHTKILYTKIGQLQSVVEKLTAFITDGFVTVTEFHLITGLSKKVILLACQEGRLKCQQSRDGGQWTILKSEKERLLTEALHNLNSDLAINGRSLKNAQYKKLIEKQLSQ